MRVVVFFDLSTVTSIDRRNYRRFRGYLLKKGFMMLQESVYCKLALNMTAANAIMHDVRLNKVSKGFILMLALTEKQFSNIEIVLGELETEIIHSDNRVLVL